MANLTVDSGHTEVDIELLYRVARGPGGRPAGSSRGLEGFGTFDSGLFRVGPLPVFYQRNPLSRLKLKTRQLPSQPELARAEEFTI